ncbi:hypothetical protein EJB05_38522, partial [Eragrostis curvula]
MGDALLSNQGVHCHVGYRDFGASLLCAVSATKQCWYEKEPLSDMLHYWPVPVVLMILRDHSVASSFAIGMSVDANSLQLANSYGNGGQGWIVICTVPTSDWSLEVHRIGLGSVQSMLNSFSQKVMQATISELIVFYLTQDQCLKAICFVTDVTPLSHETVTAMAATTRAACDNHGDISNCYAQHPIYYKMRTFIYGERVSECDADVDLEE